MKGEAVAREGPCAQQSKGSLPVFLPLPSPLLGGRDGPAVGSVWISSTTSFGWIGEPSASKRTSSTGTQVKPDRSVVRAMFQH